MRRIAPLLLVLTHAAVALADAPSDANRAEAAERFQRGIKLYQAGNLAGALAEFEKANELLPHPTVLYNIGLTHSDLDQPVQAERALEKLVAAPGSLSAERLERAKKLLEASRARVGEVGVEVTVQGAQVELDGVVVGTAPLAAPLRLSTGPHVIGALAPGHAPVRKSVTVASGVKGAVKLEPPAIEGRLAHLALKTGVPGASLLVDGEVVARTPLPATLTFLPGPHELILRRQGYADAKTRVVLGEGAVGEVALEPEEDTIWVQAHGGDLRLALSEPQASITIDGKVRGAYLVPLRLAPGAHHLKVERGGFRTIERDVSITEGKETFVTLELEPTPEKRAAHAAEANQRRTISFVTIGVGAALLAGSAAFLGWNVVNKQDAQKGFDDLYAQCTGGMPQVCEGLTRRESAVNQALTLDVLGGVGVAVGAVVVGTGITLLATGEDPKKYDKRPTETLGLVPRLFVGPGVGWVGLGGSF